MTTIWDATCADLKVGDCIVSDKDTIEVTDIHRIGFADTDTPSWQVFGRITRGWGKGKKVRSWLYHDDRKFDIERTP